MILPDINLLIYAHNEADVRYPAAKQWFEDLLNSNKSACFCWETLNGFIRISTNPAAMPKPLSLAQAFNTVQGWMEQPTFVLLTPRPDHMETLRRTAIDAEAAGKRFSDAVLAAYAISYNIRFASTDRHFRMFSKLKLIDPLSDH